MTTAFAVSPRPGRASEGRLTALQAIMLRDRLGAGMGEWTAQFARDAAVLAVLAADPSDDPTALDRARTALQMYSAIEAIEEIQHSLVRIKNGTYGTCQSCGGPIPFERLEVIPQTRFCAACPVAIDPRARSRRGPVRGERTGVPNPPSRALAAEGHAHDPRVLAASRDRHPSSIRYPRSPDDPAPDEHWPGSSRKPERDVAVS